MPKLVSPRTTFWLAAIVLVAATFGRAGAKPINLKQRAAVEYADDLKTHIKHIVVIIQENRSFDNFFHDFPGADSVDEGMTPDGPVPLHPVDLALPVDVDHQRKAFLVEYNGGKMDGWQRVE